jgi:hypothetical protein
MRNAVETQAIAERRAAQVRGTQTLVDQMGWMLRRPGIVAVEVGWRWLFGVPFLLVCWARLHHVLSILTLEESGLRNLDVQNPWIAAAQLSRAFAKYEPLIAHELKWLAPIAVLAWIVVSAIGRSLALYRMEPGLRFQPLAMMVLQTVWLALFGGVCLGWFWAVSRTAIAHFPETGEPDLIGFAIWLIFLSLAFFTVWALAGWAVSVAPVLMLLEKRSPIAALAEGFRLGRVFTSELVEIGMVMGIVNLALLILAMVLSAAPLPFSDQLGPEAMHTVWAAAAVFYLIAHDYFQLVRLKCLVQFWRIFRGGQTQKMAR